MSNRQESQRPATPPWLWLLLIVACTVGGTLAGTKTLSNSGSGTGESQRASSRLTAAGLQAPAVESVLVRSSEPARTHAAVAAIESSVRPLPDVLEVHGPADSHALIVAGGKTALVQVELRGDAAKAKDHVDAITAAVINAEAGLNWLRAEPPDLEAVRQALNGIASDGKRAAEIVVRLRVPMKRSPNG